ncbi:MAG: MarR family transcriptional regulator [Acidobacteriota bacterium]
MTTDDPGGQMLGDAIFLGRSADALSQLIAKQVEAVFDGADIRIPVKSCSLISTLAALEPASAADLAKALDQSHQLVLQKIPALLGAGLLDREKDPGDGRRKVFRLTPEGHRQLERLQGLAPAIEAIYQELYRELGVDLRAALDGAAASLRDRPVAERLEGPSLSGARRSDAADRGDGRV